MCRGVRILNSTTIPLPPLPQIPPPIKLSLFDVIWIGVKPVQRVMLYSPPKTDLTFSTIVERLKSSLSSTLLDFLPLAGKLVYVASTGGVEIDVSDPSVKLIEAESDLDLHRLVTEEVQDTESFAKLLPAIDTDVLPFSLFVVQVTRFECGGVAIGYSYHHTVADGKALIQFIETWARTCKIKIDGVEQSIKHNRSRLYDRSVIKHPRGDEIVQKILRRFTPTLPSTKVPVLTYIEEARLQLNRRTFLLNASSIQYLKQSTALQEVDNSPFQPPSTFSVISSHAWSCIARAKSLDPNKNTVIGIAMDCRTRLDPPVDEYFGNCIRGVFVTMRVDELIGKDGLKRACEAIRKKVREVSEDPLGDFEDWIDQFIALPFDRLANVVGSPRFRVYETDFGWGKPDRCEFVSMNFDGEFSFAMGKEEDSVQMTIALKPTQMDTFAEFFLNGLNK